MQIEEYLEARRIRWFPMNMEITWDSSNEKYKKRPAYVQGKGGLGGYMPKTDDFERLTDKELQERQEKIDNSTHIAIETQRVKQMDFDTDEHTELMEAMKEKTPYFLSTTKKLPHCFMISEELSAKRVLTKYRNVEILGGIWSFCEKGVEVINAELEPPEINVEPMLHSVYKEERQESGGVQIDYETVEKVVKSLNESRCNEYDEWLQVIFAIMKTGEDNGYPQKAEELAHSWSKQHPKKYDRAYLSKLIKDHFKADRSPGYGTLCYKLKQDNQKLFKQLCKQNKVAEVGPPYEEVKEHFEEHTFKILNPPAYVSIIESKMEYNILSEYQLLTKYRHLVYNMDERFIKRWIEDPKIRRYSLIDFMPPPMKCPEAVFNTWTGFGVCLSEESTGDIELILKHIEYLCNHEEASIQYFTKWLAHIVQRPGDLNGIAVVLQGDKGVGKNTLTYLLRDMMGGQYYSEVSEEDVLFGRFSNVRLNKILINIDEIQLSFKKKDALKNMITSKVYNHETKGVSPIEMRNFNRFIFTTNNDIPLPIEVGDRRLVVFTADDSIANDKEYFDKLHECCNDGGAQRAFYEYLKAVDISTVHWVGDRPLTEDYMDIQSVMIPMIARFMKDYAEHMKGNDTVRAGDLYAHYKDYMQINGYEKETKKSIGFGMQIKKYKGMYRERSNGTTSYMIHKGEILEYLYDKYKI